MSYEFYEADGYYDKELIRGWKYLRLVFFFSEERFALRNVGNLRPDMSWVETKLL